MLRFGSLTVNVSADSLLFFHCCCYCKFSINSQPIWACDLSSSLECHHTVRSSDLTIGHLLSLDTYRKPPTAGVMVT